MHWDFGDLCTVTFALTFEVTTAVCVAVLEAAHVNLVENRLLPPAPSGRLLQEQTHARGFILVQLLARVNDS